MRKTKLKLFASIISIICLLGIAAVGCVSPTAFSVAITSPEDGSTVTESPITVTGTVSGYPRGEVTIGEQKASLSPEVTINGVKADVDADGGFSAQVELTEGTNTIVAVAMFNNVEVQDSIMVTYAASAPELSIEITSPEDGAELTESLADVTGTVSDNTSTITVNGVEVEVDDEGTFSAQVELAEGENTIEAVATLGEESAQDSITVIYTQPAPILASIAVEPPSDLEVGATQQLTATGTYSDDSTADITSEVTWTSSDTAVASIDDTGIITGLAVGQTEITAAMSDVTSPAVLLTVVPAVPPFSIEITSPEDGVELSDNPVTGTGTVSDPEATITVNGVVVTSDENGSFSFQVVLAEGENTIYASAVLGEAQAQDSVVVAYNPDPAPAPEVKIISPEDGSELTENQVTINGTVSPHGAVVAVNGVVVANNGNDGTFSAQVMLAEGQNTITSTAILGEKKAKDSITVFYNATAPEPALASIAVEPASPDNLAVGATQQFTAVGTYSDDSTADITSEVTWASSDAAIAAIDAAGLATGIAAGTTVITASLSDITSPVVPLTVVSEEPALSVEIISPENGAELSESPVVITGMVSDSSSTVTVNGIVAEVAADGSFSAQIELTEGENTVEVIAASGEEEASASITVVYSPSAAPELTSIEVTASPDNLVIGDTRQFTAVGTFSDDSTADITSEVTWASSDAAVAAIDAAGLAVGVAAGSTVITASLSGITSPEFPLTVITP